MRGTERPRSAAVRRALGHPSGRAAAAGRAARALLVLVCAAVAGCTGDQAAGARPATNAGPVPRAVMEHGVLLLHGSIPAQLEVSATEGGDYEVTPAARANGVEASYAVS